MVPGEDSTTRANPNYQAVFWFVTRISTHNAHPLGGPLSVPKMVSDSLDNCCVEWRAALRWIRLLEPNLLPG